MTSKVPFLRNYNIPEPVSGGLIAFFTTIGLSSRFSTLLKGGSQPGILLVLAVVYLVIQDAGAVGTLPQLGVALRLPENFRLYDPKGPRPPDEHIKYDRPFVDG